MTEAERQHQINKLAEQFGEKAAGTPFFLLAKGEQKSAKDFETHFNPQLTHKSTYFSNLDKMLKCVERNASATNKDTICATEFKALRMAAFKDELLYHNVNKQFFMNELAVKKGESPY